LRTSIERVALPKIEGRVRDGVMDPLPNVLIEVFDKPDWIIEEKNKPPGDQTRIIACESSKSGKFSIKGLKTGNYELRVSMNPGFNVSYIYVSVVSTSKTNARKLKIYLTVGT